MKSTEQLAADFETMFGIPFTEGAKHVKRLMARSVYMGRSTAGLDWSGFMGLDTHSYSRTTLDDRDFLMFAFFSMAGLERFENLLPPEVELLPAGSKR